MNEFDECIADSRFNQSDLEKLGCHIPIRPMPILVKYEDFDQEPAQDVLDRYDDDIHNFLFVGRIAPNKCQQDVIEIFSRYKEHYDEKARLFLVGSSFDRAYVSYVHQVAETSGYSKDIIFPGHIPFSHVISYYHLADLFICMSEHEGFCVPVLEAMKMKVPVVAYDACAVPETMGDAGILIKKKDYEAIAHMMHELIENPRKRRELVKRQEKRLANFAYEKVAAEYGKIFKSWMEA